MLAIFQHFGLFSLFFPLSVDLALDVRFRKNWYLRKSCNVYFPMAQILYHSEFWLRNCGLWNKGCHSDFVIGNPFFGVDFGQLGDALDDSSQQLLGKLIIFEKLPTLWKLMDWIEKTLRTKVASKWVSFCPKYLVKFH